MPSKTDLISWFSDGVISESNFRFIMGELGYKFWAIERYVQANAPEGVIVDDAGIDQQTPSPPDFYPSEGPRSSEEFTVTNGRVESDE